MTTALTGTQVLEYIAGAFTTVPGVGSHIVSDLLLSDPFNQGSGPTWHGLQQQNITEWDASTVAAIFVQQDTDIKLSVRMVSVSSSGVTTAGPTLVLLNSQNGDSRPSNAHTPYIRRVGDLLVLMEPASGHLFTMSVDPVSLAITLLDQTTTHPFSDLTGPSPDHGAGIRFVPWGSAGTDILMVQCYPSTSLLGRLAFAHWDGTTWSYGAITSSADSAYGSTDYQEIGRVDDSHAIVVAEVGGTYTNTRYDVVTGAYPAAPTVTPSITTGYYDGYDVDEMHEGSTPGTLIRQVPLNPGTTNPKTGSGSWDYGWVTLTLDGSGAVVQSAPTTYSTTITPSPNYPYISRTAQTADGQVWGAYTPAQATMAVHMSEDSVSTVTTIGSDRPDGGLDNNFWYSARAGNTFLIGYQTLNNLQFRLLSMTRAPAVQADGTPPNALTVKGPSTAGQGDYQKHQGKFAIGADQTISALYSVQSSTHPMLYSVQSSTDPMLYSVQSSTDPIWVKAVADFWALSSGSPGSGSTATLIESRELASSQQVGASGWLTQHIFDSAPSGATHWVLRVLMSPDPAMQVRLPEGFKVFFDGFLVPDNGKDLSANLRSFFDGDSPGCIWEGDAEDSTSIFGNKPAPPPSTVTLDDDLVLS